MANELELYYQDYDEEGRLFRDRCHQMEWETTMVYLRQLIPAHSHIYDGCAGTGNYAFPLASLGHTVFASDIVPSHVDKMIEKQKTCGKLAAIHQGDMRSVDRYGENTFDVVLCMGAFYHLHQEDRKKVLEESLRILKTGGLLVISYINNSAVTALKLAGGLDNIAKITAGYKKQTFDDIFLHTTPEEMVEMVSHYPVKIIKHIRTEGLAYLYGDKFNEASEQQFKEYMELHLSSCEEPSMLGAGIHGLMILQKSVD